MVGPAEALDAVGQLPDTEIDIAGAALHFARIGAPSADWKTAARLLSTLAREAVALSREMEGGDLAARAGALAGLIAGRHRFIGDSETYDDLANANLIRVLERRRGLPVALGILWLHCARAAGWAAHGVDFPGHFLLALGREPASARPRRAASAQHLILDVFAGGLPLEARDLRALLKRVAGPEAELRPGVLAPMSARAVLLRLQHNIRGRRLAAGEVEGALGCTLDMLRIAPDHAGLWREAAAMHRTLDQVSAALRCYARALELVPEGEAAARTRSAMEELRGRLN